MRDLHSIPNNTRIYECSNLTQKEILQSENYEVTEVSPNTTQYSI